MDNFIVIGHRGVNNCNGIQEVMGTADICQLMEKAGITVDRLEMREVLLLNPERVRHIQTVAIEVEHEFVFGMRAADREIKRADIVTLIK
jgi:sulfur carrier protein ThiS